MIFDKFHYQSNDLTLKDHTTKTKTIFLKTFIGTEKNYIHKNILNFA